MRNYIHFVALVIMYIILPESRGFVQVRQSGRVLQLEAPPATDVRFGSRDFVEPWYLRIDLDSPRFARAPQASQVEAETKPEAIALSPATAIRILFVYTAPLVLATFVFMAALIFKLAVLDFSPVRYVRAF
jgi:hypothetical protein